MGKGKVKVTMRALLQRINRALAHEDEMLKVARGDRQQADVGNYYIVNFNRNYLVAQHVDPEDLGRELKVLRAWEEISD